MLHLSGTVNICIIVAIIFTLTDDGSHSHFMLTSLGYLNRLIASNCILVLFRSNSYHNTIGVFAQLVRIKIGALQHPRVVDDCHKAEIVYYFSTRIIFQLHISITFV